MLQRAPSVSCSARPHRPRSSRGTATARCAGLRCTGLRSASLRSASLISGCFPAALLAAESAPPALPAVGVPTGALVQGLLGLLLIIGLLLVTLAALKRWGGKFGGVSTAGMKVVSGLSVGTRERILLIEVGDTWLVVGVTASQIRTLHTLPRNALPELAGPANKPAFAQWLSAVMERKRHDA